MGCCGAKDEQDSQVQSELDEANKKDSEIKKLLFLGAGGSGKTTLFKQLQNIHGKGFAARDRTQFKSQIYEQIMETMKMMIKKVQDTDSEYSPIEDEKERMELKFDDNNLDCVEFIDTRPNNIDMNDEIKEKLKQLWQDTAIQKMFSLRAKICVPDSTGYFMDNIDRICDASYVPSDEDLLLVRYRTTGMTEKIFNIDNNTFKICDVGGQRNERRKWIHFFDGVTAVIFVVALSCYDEVTFEDEDTNAMHEALDVFEDQVNSAVFQDTAFILFLNKNDLFMEKIKKVPITDAFPEYTGAQEYQASLDYIRGQFEAKNDKPDDRHIYVHVTNATDKENIQRIFADVQHIVIQWSLEHSGLI